MMCSISVLIWMQNFKVCAIYFQFSASSKPTTDPFKYYIIIDVLWTIAGECLCWADQILDHPHSM